MKTHVASILAAAALGLAPASALAQSAPPTTAPVAPAPPVPSSGSMTSPTPDTPSPAPAMSSPGASQASPAPASSPSTRGTGGTRSTSTAAKSVKKIPNGSLSFTDLRYGLTHPLQEANQLRKMKSVSFDKLRVYRLSSNLKSMLKVGDANSDIPVLAELGPPILLAQTSGPLPGTNGSNSPIAYLQYVLANINVSNALNNVNVLNNSNVNVGVSLQDVLNGNKISIGQVAGIFVNGLGIITTITK